MRLATSRPCADPPPLPVLVQPAGDNHVLMILVRTHQGETRLNQLHQGHDQATLGNQGSDDPFQQV